MKKIILAIIIILALAVLVFWFFSKPKEVPTGENSIQTEIPANDTAESIGQDIEKEANIGDLNDDFKDVEGDLQSL